VQLGELLDAERIRIGLSARTKEEAIEELIDLLVRADKLERPYRDLALKAVMDRERSLSTGMEHGVALPHGALDEVSDLSCTLGITREGIDFVSLDGKPAHLIVLLVIPRKKFSRHVRTLAGIARLLNSAEMRAKLLTAGDAAQAMSCIREEEARFAVLEG
jgi:mannitol/fructose-specific phosphotransferase system IIA component (Ntr-type)